MNEMIQKDIRKIVQTRTDLEQLKGSTMLISGANSFIMSYFLYTLLECNKQKNYKINIIALCRDREKAKKRLENYLHDQNLTLLIQDIREPVAYGGPIDYCIHAASPAGIRSRQEYPAETFQTNVKGCENLLQICRKQKIKKFMLISSVDVYGDCGQNGRLKESDIGKLDWIYKRNAYSNGKRAAETLCCLYAEQYRLPCVIVRPFQVYGPGMSLTDGRLHGDFIRQILKSNKILLKSDGKAQRSFLYLLDASNALFDVLLKGRDREIYNICDENGEMSVCGLARMYAKAAGAAVEFIYGERETPEVKEAPSAVLGYSGKLRELGWEGRTSLEEGIEKTLRFYRETERELYGI